MFHLVKRVARCFFTVCVVLVWAGCASRQKSYNTTILQTAKNLSNLYKVEARPWPNFNLLHHPILFVSFNEKMVKRLIKRELQDLNYDLWSQKIPTTAVEFDTVTIDKQKYLILHLDNFEHLSSQELMVTALHEGFHYFGQSEWARRSEVEGRGTLYPVDAIPRYYRWEMKTHLLAYFKNKNPDELRRYSYWYDKWKTNIKDEYQNYTDRIEGSAQYYTNQMITIFRNLDGEKKVTPLEVFESNTATNQSFRKMFSLSYESYVLGTLSGILLEDLTGSGWQKTVMLDPSSLELLARLHKPLRDQVDHKEQNEYIYAAIRKMEKIDSDGKLDQIISDLANPNVVKVAVNSKGLQFSSFATEGIFRSFFNYPGIKEIQMIKLASPHRVRGTDIDLQYSSGDIWVTSQQTPCGKDHASVLTFQKDQIQFQKGLLTTTTGAAKTLPAFFKKVKNSDWFCVNFKPVK